MRYVRIDDVGLADLESTNKKRVDEIETTTSELEQLKVKKKELEKDHSEARITRHDAMERMKSNNDHKECQNHLNRRCHALLQNIQSPKAEVQCEIKKMQPVKRPESNLLFKSFESLSSPYDD
jgi:FtsZ-binding cell division protein ZapB